MNFLYSKNLKIAFVGVACKTSILNGIVNNPNYVLKGSNSVIVQYEGSLARLNFDDIAGLDVYDRTRQFRYSGNDVFVICYSVNDHDSFLDVETTWIRELTKAGYVSPSAPKILCAIEDGTATEGTIKISRQMGEKMKEKINCMAYLECSSQTLSGTSELVSQICKCGFPPTDDRLFDFETGKLYSESFFKEPGTETMQETQETSSEFETIQEIDFSELEPVSVQNETSKQPNKGIFGKLKNIFKPKKEKPSATRHFYDFPFEEWTTEEVGIWLEFKGCNQSIIQILKKQEFNGSALFYCEKQDLTSLNIPLGNAISIMKWIEPFKKHSNQANTFISTDEDDLTTDDSKNIISAYNSGENDSGNNSSSFEIDFSLSEISPNIAQPQENEFDKRYTVIEKLGTGGFGSVYKVMTKKSKVIRAVKIVSPTQDFTVNQALSEAMKQIQLYREDNHIVHVYDVFIAEELNTQRQIVCIEMDCMEGSIKPIFKNRTVSEGMIWSIMRQIATSLKFLSETGKIIHRDIKPDNILVKKVDFEQDEIEVYLSDFGLAKYDSNSTQTSILSGTILYIAPEILDFANNFGESGHGSPYSIYSDIFALGVSLYQIMSKDTTSNIATLCKYGSDLIKQNFPQDLYSDKLMNLVLEMLRRYPHERPSIDEILSF